MVTKSVGASAPGPERHLLNTVEAAAFLDLEPETLERWRPMRRGPKFIKIGGNVRYRRSDLDAFLEAQTVQTSMKK